MKEILIYYQLVLGALSGAMTAPGAADYSRIGMSSRW